MDTLAIGRRIAYWRARRRMTHEVLASLLGRSVRWVEDLEGGRRQSDPRLSVLESVAGALKIPLQSLLADAPTARCVDQVELGLIGSALQHHDVITGTASPAGARCPSPSCGRGWCTPARPSRPAGSDPSEACCPTWSWTRTSPPPCWRATSGWTPAGSSRSPWSWPRPPRSRPGTLTWRCWPATGQWWPPRDPKTRSSRRVRPATWRTR
ncbi:helix-turn-helix domain-containing protein [Kitasatospora aburaviensis]